MFSSFFPAPLRKLIISSSPGPFILHFFVPHFVQKANELKPSHTPTLPGLVGWYRDTAQGCRCVFCVDEDRTVLHCKSLRLTQAGYRLLKAAAIVSRGAYAQSVLSDSL